MSGDRRLFLWLSVRRFLTFHPIPLVLSGKRRTFVAVMNWSFILRTTIKFVLSMVVYYLAVWKLNSLWWAFVMALGFMILIAIAEGYVIDWIQKLKDRKEK